MPAAHWRTVEGGPGDSSAIVVQRQDNLYTIAKRYGVELRDLIETNRLSPPYHIYPGQALTLPKKRVHIVRYGETVTSIAQIRSVDVYNLVKLNRLQPPYSLQEGQRLKLPFPQEKPLLVAVKTAAAKRPSKAPTPVSKERIAPPDKHVELVDQPPQAAAPSRPAIKQPSQNGTKPKQTKCVPSQSPAKELPPIDKFHWPLKGKILAKYGKKQGGLKNEGLNIQGKQGANVLAAETGQVVYCGDALKGYGNLILLKHRGGWVTAYAHLGKILVQKGETVKKGSKMATVGATGNVDQPQLHFEIRRQTRTVDPLKYLR
jgi:murein DD-endopeptidase MepM/ murein hydrolase activator NlpD